jgi:hypothetical protein
MTTGAFDEKPMAEFPESGVATGGAALSYK